MVQSVDRALEILEHLKRSKNGLGITDLSRRLDVAKSTVHRLVSSLEKYDYVKRVDDRGIYGLGLKFLEMNQVVIEKLNIVETAHPVLDELTARIDEITHLGMLDGYDLIYIDKVETTSTIRIYSQTGRRAPMYCTGIGKALLAYFQESKLAAYLDHHELLQYTDTTLTNPVKLKEELEEIKEKGYAVDNEEHEKGVRCVAAPIFNHIGEVCYAISVTAPSSRMTDSRMKEIIPLILKTSDTISKKMGYRP